MSDNAPRASRIFTARRAAAVLVAATAVAGIAFAAAPERAPIPSLDPIGLFPQGTAAGMQAAGLLTPAVAAGDGVRLTARLDRTQVLTGSDGTVRAQLTLAADPVEGDAEAVPSDFVVVVDTSSSMSGEKFDDAMRALHGLLGRLRPIDRLAVVAYSGQAWIQLPLDWATPESLAVWRQNLNSMRPGGSTNISAALDLADQVLVGRGESMRPARVLLLSDGEPTAGDTGHAALIDRARRAGHRGYVLGAVGIGLGFNEILMSGLADAGAGNFHSLHAEGGLDAILAAEFDAARGTVASQLAVTLKPGAGVRIVDAAGYPLERTAEGVTFRPGNLFGGQTRTIWVTLAVPADRPDATHLLGEVNLDFVREGQHEAMHPLPLGRVSTTADQTQFVAHLDKQTWEKSVVDGRFADIEKQLAAHVRAGRADDARKLLDEHAAQTAVLNTVVGSAAVDAHLTEVAARRKALDDAFTGADQAHKRNVFSKMNTASGWSRSRAGSLSGR